MARRLSLLAGLSIFLALIWFIGGCKTVENRASVLMPPEGTKFVLLTCDTLRDRNQFVVYPDTVVLTGGQALQFIGNDVEAAYVDLSNFAEDFKGGPGDMRRRIPDAAKGQGLARAFRLRDTGEYVAKIGTYEAAAGNCSVSSPTIILK